MELELKKTAPPLKWLAEKRARVLHKLTEEELFVAQLEERRVAAARESAEADARVRAHRANLAAIDRAISIHSPAFVAADIRRVRFWKGHYGNRGALTASIFALLTKNSPCWTPTHAVVDWVVRDRALAFQGPESVRRVHKSLTSRLRVLVAQGYLERGHPLIGGDVQGLWRLDEQLPPTLSELTALAARH